MFLFGKKKKAKKQYNHVPEISTINVKISAKDLNLSKKSTEIIDEESGLPFGWITHNKEFVEQVSAEEMHFLSLYTTATGVLNRYAGLKSYALYLKDGIKHYDEVGLYEGKYFRYYIANNINKYEKELKNMEENIDTLLEEEKKNIKKAELEEKARETIENDLFNIIFDNPGIVQKNIYKEFDPLLKELISSTLYWMADDKRIIREKSGNSYKLYIK